MRCLYPRTVGFHADGKTISWSQKKYSPEYAPFQLPCSKCIECRLQYAREWAIRCVHESQMHPENSFITLTYDKLESNRLQYKHFQDFMKRLRFHYPNQTISTFVTGEYGEEKKRPHWHAIIFNWYPRDAKYKYSNDRGDEVHSSETLDKIWGHGISEIGSVTIESAGYCARYAAKKLIHGRDQDHDYHPISKKSSKHAIGKKWLEKYWPDVFNYGHIVLPDGGTCGIPRYYEKWLQKNQPAAWEHYITTTKQRKATYAQDKADKEKKDFAELSEKRWQMGKTAPPISRTDVRTKIIADKFKRLTKFLKGDI